MAVTQNSFTGNGSTTTYSFTFPYLKQDEIKASLDGTATTAFTTPTATTVQFNTAPASGVKIKIFRETDTDSLAATFYAGSAIKSEDLNDNFTQNLYAVQEVTARYLSNLGGTMLGDLNLAEDVVLKFEGATDNDFETILTVTDPTADRTITLPNVTGTVVTTGDTGTVTTGMIASDAVTGAKIVDNAINSEHYTDGSIDHEHLANDIIDGDNIQDDVINSEHIAAGALDTEHYAANSVDAAALAHTSVTAGTYTAADITVDDQGRLTAAASGTIAGSEIAADAIDGTKVADNAIDSEHYTDGSIDRDHLSADIIDGSKIADNALDSEHYTDGSIDRVHLSADIIDGTKLADNSVGTEHIATNAVTTNEIADAELTTLAGMPSGTAAILADSTALTSTTAELNILDNKSFRASGDGALTTTSDTEIPSSKVVAAHVAAQIGNVGGFTTIATDAAFPATASQPANGVIISISDAAGVVVNGSGVSTTGRTTDGTPATVTINSFPSSLNGETLASGVGLLVTSTGSSNTYTYHKLLAAESDVKQLSDDINDFNARYRVAGSAPGSNNDAGDLYFDTAANKMKVYNGTTNAWDDVASVGNFYINTLSSSSGTGGGNANFATGVYRFTLSNPPTMAQQLIVSINGVIQKPNAGSSQPSEGFAIDGNDIIFSAAPAANSDYFIVTQGSSVSIGTPSDNTVSTAKIQNLGVTNAKIANDTIAEGKLDVHNAPATGKYLKYTSNGMEWSDGASEGSDVKSTGITGTDKYLRADGDNTSSWVAAPFLPLVGGVISGDTVISGTNVEVRFNDGVKADFGTGSDTSVYFDGTDTQIKSQSGKIVVSTTANNDDIEVTPHGSGNVKLDGLAWPNADGSADQILKTDGSGALGWTTISAAPEVKLTASEAITAEDSIMVKSNGQAEKITGANSGVHTASGLAYMGGRGEVIDIAYDENADKYVCMYGYGYQGSMRCQVGTPSSNGETITWGSQVEFTDIGYPAWDHEKKDINMIYDPVEQKVYFCYRDTENNGKVRHGWISISGTTPSLYGQQLMHGYTNVECVSCTTNGSNNLMVAYRRSNRPYAVRAYKSTSNIAELGNEWGTQPAAEPHCSNITFGNGGYLYTWADNNNQKKPRGVFVTNNNTGTSNGASSWSNMTYFQENASNVGTTDVGPKSAYDPNSNRFVVMWSCPNQSKVRACIVEASSSAITIKSYVTVTGSGGVSSLDACVPTKHTQYDIEFEPNSGKIVFCYADANDARIRTAKIVNDAFVWDAETEVHNQDVSGGFRCTIDKDNNQIATVATSYSGGTKDARVYTPPETNLDPNRFIGFAKASVSSGAEVTVKVNSNTSTRSGLTPGTVYYVGDTGGLSTTASNAGTIKAGVALSSTKLLIKD